MVPWGDPIGSFAVESTRAYPRRAGGVGGLAGQRLETFPLTSQWLLPVAN
jgi:hypothetical protein